MKNYGEELVYWYFRFNGFIPMANFVLHGDDVLTGSDCDLVAVRFPYVFEPVGGQENDWDIDVLRSLGHDGNRTLVTFVQVKTGQDGNQVAEIADYFRNHLAYLVERMGLWPRARTLEIVEEFNQTGVLPKDQYVLSKVVVLRTARRRRNEMPWVELPFRQVIHFIMNRLVKYAPDKFADRMQFPDPIIQLLVDQAHTKAHRWPPEEPEAAER